LLLAFVDETSDRDKPRYFGLTVATINANFYRAVKAAFLERLDESGWERSIEFKGAFLFSASKGCTTVPVDTRITLVSELLKLNTSAKYRRMKFYYAATETNDHRSEYLEILPLLLAKALPRTSKKGGKDLVKLYCDRRDDLKPADIRAVAAPVIDARGYTLVEDVVCAVSNRETVGILYADIVGYLMGRVEVILNDIDMFDGLTAEQINASSKLMLPRKSGHWVR